MERAQAVVLGLGLGKGEEPARAGVQAMQEPGLEATLADTRELGKPRERGADGGSRLLR
jgi:hypothetical protein